jgi:hypothetical protein
MAVFPSAPAVQEEVAASGLREPGVRVEYQPEFRGTKFKCPRCDVVAAQSWATVYRKGMRKTPTTYVKTEEVLSDLGISTCEACTAKCLWFEGQLVFPAQVSAHQVPADLPPELQRDFEEAASIAAASPRASAALLRMCVEGLCKTITGKDKFESAIEVLEQQGIPDEIIIAMDVVRLTGNEALHAGKLYGSDDGKTVAILFRLASLIVNWAITEKAALKDLIDKIPPEKLEHIKERRQKAAAKAALRTPRSSL